MIRSHFRIASILIFAGVLSLALLLAGLSTNISAQGERTPVPLFTLVPPTPLATPLPPTPPPPLTQSALARIKARVTSETDKPKLVVGIPYNIALFSTLTDTGEIDGFEADIAQAIADDWGATLITRQVTRHNAYDLLLSGQIDLLVGQVMLTRNAPAGVDFSDPYFANRQVALVLNDSGLKDIANLAGQNIGVVSLSRSEEAFEAWAEVNNMQANITRFGMIDEGLRALQNKQINALIGDRWDLHNKVAGRIQNVSLLPTPIRIEPYAIAMRRFDDPLRTMVNRTLQRLQQSDRLAPLYDKWFGKDLLPEDRLPIRVWNGLEGDTRAMDNFPTDIVIPAQSVIARIKSGQPLRVAGLGAPFDANGKPTILEALNQAMINELARRWGVQTQLIPNSYGRGEDLLASGEADIAVGVEAKWGPVDRIDYVGVYAERGYRLMVRVGSGIESFEGVRFGVRNIGVFVDDPEAFEIAKKLATSINIPEQTLRRVNIRTDSEAVDQVFGTQVARVLFADGLRLWPIVRANPKAVQLTKTTYNPKPISFGVPRNDVDFRVLVDATLQEMYRDGTYQRIWQSTFGLGDPVRFVVWPGPSTVVGVKMTP
jgi:ABC-type amino acid transport substrate-binding protein